MPDYSKEELSRYRLQKAKEDLETAKHDFSADHFLACINTPCSTPFGPY